MTTAECPVFGEHCFEWEYCEFCGKPMGMVCECGECSDGGDPNPYDWDFCWGGCEEYKAWRKKAGDTSRDIITAARVAAARDGECQDRPAEVLAEGWPKW